MGRCPAQQHRASEQRRGAPTSLGDPYGLGEPSRPLPCLLDPFRPSSSSEPTLLGSSNFQLNHPLNHKEIETGQFVASDPELRKGREVRRELWASLRCCRNNRSVQSKRFPRGGRNVVRDRSPQQTRGPRRPPPRGGFRGRRGALASEGRLGF